MKNLQKLFASVLLFSLAVSATNVNAVAAEASPVRTITLISREVNNKQTEIKNLNTQLDEAKRKKSILDKPENLDAEIKKLDAEIKNDLSNSITAAESVIDNERRAIETNKNTISEKRSQIQTKNTELEKLGKETPEYKSKEKEIENLRNEISNLENENSIKEDIIRQKTDEIERSKEMKKRKEEEKTKKEAEKTKAEAERQAANITETSENLGTEIQRIEGEINTKNTELNTLLNELNTKAGNANSSSDIKLKDDCRVNGTCTTETKKEEVKKEETKEIIKEIVEEAKKEIAEQPTVVIVEKELNGKKYSYTSKPAHRTIVEKLLKEDISNFNSKFVDISSSNSENDIKRLERAGVVVGTTPTTFEPSKAITRAEFLAIVLGAYGYDIYAPAKNLPFTDVNANSWQARVVSTALENGFVSNENSMFRPNEQISKIEALAILYSISGFKADATTTSFMDAAADWQTAVLAQTEYLELVNVPADKKFYPNAGISRADMASTVLNFAKLY